MSKNLGNKYACTYKHNSVVFGRVFESMNTKFIVVNENTKDEQFYVGAGIFDTEEEAINELARYNQCKLEKCNQ